MINRNIFCILVGSLIYVTMFSACGDENTYIVDDQYSGIESVENLDSCSVDNDKKIVFLLDSSSFWSCSEGKWILVNLVFDKQSVKDTVLVKDTLYLKDSLISRDTLYLYDSLVIKDTIAYKDSVFSYDTLVVKDTLFVKDTVLVYDSLVVKDTLVSKDTVFSYDTLVVKDTLVLKDSIYFVDTVYSFDTLVVNHYDTLRVYDTNTVVYVPKYDTVTTEFLNQEMLKNGDYGILVDERDNKVYRTIKIGTQTWMAQNLSYADGGVTSYCRNNSVQGNGDEYCRRFGRLYTWAAALNLDDMYNSNRATESDGSDKYLYHPAQGLCPDGYHIPQKSEFETLINYVAAQNTVNNVKTGVSPSLESVNGLWDIPAGDSYPTNTTGFSGVANGSLFGGYSATLSMVSSTENSATTFTVYILHHSSTSFKIEAHEKASFMSIRCVKN